MRRRNTNNNEAATTSPSDDKKEVRPGVGVKGCNLPSPSGINTWSLPAQALTFGIIVTGFVLATKKFSGYLESSGPMSNTPSIIFGVLYTALGMTHFVGAKDDMANIVPSYGAWGIWYVPGSKAFHVLWTGCAEVAFGLGLLASNFLLSDPSMTSLFGAGLFVLTAMVTPANIFQFTHGAKLPIESDPMPLVFYSIRFSIQVVLLGYLHQIGKESLETIAMS